MRFIDNMKSIFAATPADTSVQYGSSREWYLSDAGKRIFREAPTTVERTDYLYHYLKVVKGSNANLTDEILYRLAFLFADAILNSDRKYAGTENILNAAVNPFLAYLERLNRSLSNKFLCYELILILFEAVDPYDPSAWIYDSQRKGFSEEEYRKVAEENGIDIKNLLKTDYAGREQFRLILCEIIWLIGESAFLAEVR